MRLSTKGRYAVTAMFDLAMHFPTGRPLTAKEIAVRHKISFAYIEQLLLLLRKAGLVNTIRGPNGGYVLSRSPSQVNLGDIVRATEGPIGLVVCVAEGMSVSDCETVPTCCSVRSLWENLNQKIANVFDSTTLADMCTHTIASKLHMPVGAGALN